MISWRNRLSELEGIVPDVIAPGYTNSFPRSIPTNSVEESFDISG